MSLISIPNINTITLIVSSSLYIALVLNVPS